jgi:hypothetical protein
MRVGISLSSAGDIDGKTALGHKIVERRERARHHAHDRGKYQV